jgi:16S rRNA (guanine527-N7)-methyltransferase
VSAARQALLAPAVEGLQVSAATRRAGTRAAATLPAVAAEFLNTVPVHAPPEGFRSRIERALSSFGMQNLAPAIAGQLGAYCDLVVVWNQRVDLTAARDADELVDILIADAIAITALRPAPAGEHWLDVGSGVGAPGIPLALLAPIRMTLVEPRSKRVAFLRTAAGSLGRPDITVMRARSDDLPDASCAVAIARATLPPPAWLKEGARLATQGVWLLLAKSGLPALNGLEVLADVNYQWPLTRFERRAVCVATR